ncbi:PGH1 [Symbiodinium necroappetens]|uniref:phosphopyruvate hydratase n=1 Tax=Symbiodinium necroappetens TaxID=1628268 RepID=A0A812IQE4_9DINO|nr:PGH1 [Symbiodinium necroappetens]
MILPVGAASFKEAMIVGAEVYHNLKAVIKKKYGQDACNVGDEGGFAPNVQDNNEALDVLMEAIKKSGHEGKVKIGTDVKSVPQLIEYYKSWLSKYPFVSIEASRAPSLGLEAKPSVFG